MSDIHARTSAAFLADAKARCDAAASVPADAAAADRAIAAIVADLEAAAAADANFDPTDRFFRGEHLGRARGFFVIQAWDGLWYIDHAHGQARSTGVYESQATAWAAAGAPAMVPMPVQQQQARDARHAKGVLSPGCIPEQRESRRGMARCDYPGKWQIGIYSVVRCGDGLWSATATGPGTMGDGSFGRTFPTLALAYLAITGEPMPGGR